MAVRFLKRTRSIPNTLCSSKHGNDFHCRWRMSLDRCSSEVSA